MLKNLGKVITPEGGAGVRCGNSPHSASLCGNCPLSLGGRGELLPSAKMLQRGWVKKAETRTLLAGPGNRMESVTLSTKQSQRWLQIHIAGLAALGTLLLGLGQGDLLWPMGMCLAAAASVVLTDITGYFRLSRTAANLIALAVVLWVLKDVRQWTGIGQVLLISKMLVYLQLILLFQQKDHRAYWQLAMISLLQVVVAAAFHQGVVFGVLLVIYFLLAVWTMILFFLYRELGPYERSEDHPGRTEKKPSRRFWLFPQDLGRRWFGRRDKSGGNPAGSVTGPIGNSASPSQSTSTFPQASASQQSSDSHQTSASQQSSASQQACVFHQASTSAQKSNPEAASELGGRRCSWASQAPRLEGGAIPTRSGLGWPMIGPVIKIALATWALTLLLFFVVPRAPSGTWRGVPVPLRHAVGFTDQVALGELGRIIQKSDEVLRIRFFDPEQRPYAVEGPLYLRGAILHYYQDGHWRFLGHPVFPFQRPLGARPLPAYRPLVLQEITIEPMDRQELFCLWPFAGSDPGLWLIEDVAHRRLLRPEENCRERFTYTLWTTALEEGTQAPLNPLGFPQDVYWDWDALLQMPRRDGQSRVPSLETLARQWVQQAGIPLEQRMNVARLLEARLKYSGRFRYSLHGQPRNPDLDPVEDFVREHPEGHCEYFATTLALMLRSLGIPCRVVVGYLCDEWNPAGGFFQVRQWHAHMWVEAYLSAPHLPSSLLQGEYGGLWRYGGWLRLDPTPLTDPLQDQPFYVRWASRLHTLWANYIVELDRFRQTEGIYRPLQEALRSVAERLQDPAWWAAVGSQIWQWLERFWAEWRRSGWFSWPGFVVSFLLGLVGGGVILLVQKFHRLRLQRPAHRPAALTRQVVEFYHRLEALLAGYGLRRFPGQTPLEFAQQAGATLAQRLQDPQWQDLPAQVVRSFYQVRFGAQNLPPTQTQHIAHILQSLKKAAKKPGK